MGITSVDDIFDDPWLLEGKRPEDIRDVFRNAGWQETPLLRGRYAGQGSVFREPVVDKAGTVRYDSGRMVEWHPGGGHHGPDAYWKVSSGEAGIVRVGPQFCGKG